MPTLDRRISMSFEGSEKEVWGERTALDVDSEGARCSYKVRYFTRTGGGRVRVGDIGKLTTDDEQPWQVVALHELERRRYLQLDCEALTR